MSYAIDGEYRFDDALIYGYRSLVWKGFAHYGESLAAHSFLNRVHHWYWAHEKEGQPTFTILYMHKPQQILGLYGFFVVNTL